jgi:alpha-ketoglutarate-dependent taurine dioxygenase
MVEHNASRQPSLSQQVPGRRRAVPLQGEPPYDDPGAAGPSLPLLVAVPQDGGDRFAWAAEHRDWLAAKLVAHGGILLRGLHLGGVEEFERFIRALSDEVLDYTFRSTPRTRVGGKIYTSTEYPADQSIPLHNEMSYTRSWPRKIWFCCLQAAASGGETPIADSRKVYAEIPRSIRERFAASGVMYVRNYGSGLDLPWQEVFQTADRGEVEAFCRRSGIDLEWRGQDELRTRQACQATARHPETGEGLWFNQAHLFHPSSLEPELRRFLLEELGEQGLPRQAFYGDGSAIEAGVLDEIRAAYQRHQVTFPWHEGDVLMLDNMLVAHGRRPYEGARRVVVGMAESWPRQQSDPEKEQP